MSKFSLEINVNTVEFYFNGTFLSNKLVIEKI